MTENEAIEILDGKTREQALYQYEANDRPYVIAQAEYIAIKALRELQQYHSIGTVEECREARERQIGKKPVEYEDKYYACPVCNNVLMYKWEIYPTQLKDKKCGLPYCLSCGQAIDWSE